MGLPCTELLFSVEQGNRRACRHHCLPARQRPCAARVVRVAAVDRRDRVQTDSVDHRSRCSQRGRHDLPLSPGERGWGEGAGANRTATVRERHRSRGYAAVRRHHRRREGHALARRRSAGGRGHRRRRARLTNQLRHAVRRCGADKVNPVAVVHRRQRVGGQRQAAGRERGRAARAACPFPLGEGLG